MKKMNASRVRYAFICVSMMVAMVFLIQCGASDQAATGDNNNVCAVSEDCPTGFSCITASGICGLDPDAYVCASNTDCKPNYLCYIDPNSSDGIGKCVPQPQTTVDGDIDKELEPLCTSCASDAACGDVGKYFCYNQCCELRNPPCPNGEGDCWPGQRCVMQDDGSTLLCVGDVGPDGDIDDKPDGDIDAELDVEKEVEITPTCPGGTCQTSADCTDGKVCGAGGCCVESCVTAGCTGGGECNTNNGYCEWCDETCAPNQCCNYYENFWYCGSCCTPPCAEGQACQGGQCITLVCPTCEPCFICNPSTGYLCVADPSCTDGDVDNDRSGNECLPANASCTEGVDQCCSGTCLMGTCL